MSLPQLAQLEFEIEEIEQEANQRKRGKSFLFDFNKGDFVLKDGKFVRIEGLEALKQWIWMNIKTEKYRFRVYDGTDFGLTLEQLIGSNYPFSFVTEEIKRVISDGLLVHESITDLSNWNFERDREQIIVSFEVNSIYGEFRQEVSM